MLLRSSTTSNCASDHVSEFPPGPELTKQIIRKFGACFTIRFFFNNLTMLRR